MDADTPKLVERLRMRALARLSLKRPTALDKADAELDVEAADTIERLIASEQAAARRALEMAAEVAGAAVKKARTERIGCWIKEFNQDSHVREQEAERIQRAILALHPKGPSHE